MRAGGRTLTLLGTRRIIPILRSLADGPKGQLELRRSSGLPAQSTLRCHLGTLKEADAIESRRSNSPSGALEYDLTAAGRDLLAVASHLERWLEEAPGGALEPGGDAAKAAIKGLVDGWSANVLNTLATEPHSLTELDKRISTISYPTLERCLQTMRLAEQLETGDRGSKGTPYIVTDWLRLGIGPLVAAAYWESRCQAANSAPVCQDDVDGAFALVAPLIDLPRHLAGIAQLSAKASEEQKRRNFMAFFEVQNGRAAFGSVYPQGAPDAWASGALEAWFAALLDGDEDDLELSGDLRLAGAVVDGVRTALFASQSHAHSRRNSPTS